MKTNYCNSEYVCVRTNYCNSEERPTFFSITAAALLGQAGGAFHHLSVEVVPDPITFLEDISGEGHIFGPAPSWLSQPALPLTGYGPSASVSLSGEGPYFRSQLPAGKAGVPCLVHRIGLPTLSTPFC